MSKPDPEAEYKELGPCPFCFGNLAAAEAVGGVMHTIPYCRQFEEAEDALAFVKMCNDKLGRPN